MKLWAKAMLFGGAAGFFVAVPTLSSVLPFAYVVLPKLLDTILFAMCVPGLAIAWWWAGNFHVLNLWVLAVGNVAVYTVVTYGALRLLARRRNRASRAIKSLA